MFKFSADHHFVIGHDHVLQAKPCQDHALSFAGDHFAVAVVSDGCSSGGETDMGARLRTFSLMNTIKRIQDGVFSLSQAPQEIILLQDQSLKEVSGLIGYSPHDALATSLYAYVTPKGSYVHLRGDGVIALRLHDGSFVLSRYDWANNLPFYPAYEDDGANLERFITLHGGSRANLALTEERWVQQPGCVFTKVSETMHSVEKGIQGIVLSIAEDTLATLSSIAVFTDGVTQIDGVDWKDAAMQLLDFKTREGAFVKRRMNRALKEYRKTGHGPLDDIACGVILIENQEACLRANAQAEERSV